MLYLIIVFHRETLTVRKKDIELLAYTKVIVNKQVPEADTPVDEQR